MITWRPRRRATKVSTRLPLTQLRANDAHVDAFKALAHLSSLQVFFFLVRAQGEVSAGAIQEAVGVPGPTLSHHLDQLRRAGLIERRKEERYIYYLVRRETVTALVRVLTEREGSSAHARGGPGQEPGSLPDVLRERAREGEPRYAKFLPDWAPVNLALSTGGHPGEGWWIMSESRSTRRRPWWRTWRVSRPPAARARGNGRDCCHANQDKFWDPDGAEWGGYHLNYDLEDEMVTTGPSHRGHDGLRGALSFPPGAHVISKERSPPQEEVKQPFDRPRRII